ncbi:PREDICTED: uncharacterized protein LOC105461373 [Wasmannia auropunctata]|uniref:uncharacterized protein LOC105461373 n=1 Tax=Wasmannia auropunctata TaxID=64793 RepID=UPI0005F08AD1|nr:PREDICTED: uncharacterized protein LOC105461373 [Wasmannia auropunctata]
MCIQATWLQGLDWDTPLPDDSAKRWITFLDELPRLVEIQVPRWLSCSSVGETLELHRFADASERAYGAAIYLRRRGSDGWRCSLMTAKTRVAPLKQISLPRLELCAASLLVRLVIHVREVLTLSGKPIYLWSDSTVTLGWIRGHPSRWKTFVANRVSDIQTTLPDGQWRHVASEDNPADCASRGLSPGELAQHVLWWRGPAWLTGNDDSWRNAKATAGDGELPEQRLKVHVGTSLDLEEEVEVLQRYSTLQRVLRIAAWCRRWLLALKSDRDETLKTRTLSADEIDQALLSLVRLVQARHYSGELEAVRKGKPLSTRSLLTKLNPFLEKGVLRVGGRIKHSLLAFDERHPIILPRRSILSTLVIRSCHSRTLHGGVQQTLGLLRQRFWIPGGRLEVKACIHRCLRCLRWRAAIPQPLMGDLPESRVTPSRPFQFTGVDYAGPVMLRTSGGRGHKAHKAYIAVFVCFCTKAVHLEVVSDYTTDAFLAALRRFTSRRGVCQVLYSDCGTNFTGADAALRRMFSASSREARSIGRILAEERIQWRFNPPAAPHFGGLWEAAVKSLKHHLRRVVGESTLTFEEMATLLAQVEACLNSRPLHPLSDDPDDLTALTPGHFLVGSALSAIPEPSLEEVATSRLSRWQHLQKMRGHFWDRWSSEYVHTLAARPKWWKGATAPTEGQLCLIRNETTPPTKWPLARITAVHRGRDGHVRVVSVRTATTSFTRPLVKIVLLPVESERENQK